MKQLFSGKITRKQCFNIFLYSNENFKNLNKITQVNMTNSEGGKNYIEEINNVEYPMIFVPPGSFMMGNEKYEKSQPVHELRFEKGFYIGKYPVTQKVWKAVMGENNNPSEFKGDSRPVETITWDEVKKFIEKLNKNQGNKFDYRLPSESEWEYAARGGEKGATDELIYSGSNRLEEVGWYTENSGRQTTPVGLKMGNQLGIHDMSGNVWEWCEDDWAKDYKDHPEDGTAYSVIKGKKDELITRVVRGGSWNGDDGYCSVFFRVWFRLDFRFDVIGFRLARY